MKIKYAGLVVALVLLAIIVFFNRKDIALVHQQHFELKSISSDGYELKSVIRLHNPNMLSITIKTIRERYYLDSVFIGEFVIDVGHGIPGRKESDLPVSVRFSKEVVPQSNSDSIPSAWQLIVEGEVEFENFTGSRELKMNHTQPLSIPR